MPNYGQRCVGCSHEDCPCCEVYLEWAADQRADNEPDEMDEMDDDYIPDEPDDMTDVEADADTLASAGMGADEDYNHYETVEGLDE